MFVPYKAGIIALLCLLAHGDGNPIRVGTTCTIDRIMQALQSNGSEAISYCTSLATVSELTVIAIAITTITLANTTVTETVTQDLTITFTDIEDIAVVVTTYQSCPNRTSTTPGTTSLIQEGIGARDVKTPAGLAPYPASHISSACKRFVAAPTTTTTKTSMETSTRYIPTVTELYTVLGDKIVQKIVTMGDTYTNYVTSCT